MEIDYTVKKLALEYAYSYESIAQLKDECNLNNVQLMKIIEIANKSHTGLNAISELALQTQV